MSVFGANRDSDIFYDEVMRLLSEKDILFSYTRPRDVTPWVQLDLGVNGVYELYQDMLYPFHHFTWRPTKHSIPIPITRFFIKEGGTFPFDNIPILSPEQIVNRIIKDMPDRMSPIRPH